MKIPNPTPSELKVLQILWTNGPSTVKYVHENMEQSKEVGYTTTLKIMQVMTEKGLLTRKAEGKRHIYIPAIDEDSAQDALLKRFLNAAFRGSASNLVMKALGNSKTSAKELDDIKKFIDNLDQAQNENS